MSISNYAENALLNAIGGTSFSTANTYVKLHLGDPGEDGTSNPAVETDRQAATWGSASGGSIQTTAIIEWLNVAATEVYSHWSLWDSAGPTGGNCLWTGSLGSTASMTAGDTFQLTSLQLSLD